VRADAHELGDLDLAVKLAARRPEFLDPDVLLAYSRASDRHFSTFVDELAWPQTEAEYPDPPATRRRRRL